MCRIAILITIVALAAGTIASSGSGVEAQEVMSKLVMKAGQKVWLFHSGTPDVKKEICLNDIIPVYREKKLGNNYKVEEVGKIKVLSYEGRNYFEAVVVSGEARVGDIATLNAVSCLVLSPR
jgi:hypothetical protein